MGETSASVIRILAVDLVISGNVPQGAGLSSSASLEVAVGTVFSSCTICRWTGRKSLNGQEAWENQFVGCNCGIADRPYLRAGRACVTD